MNKMIGEIILILIILMDTRSKIQHIFIIILIHIMLLMLMNTNLIAIINHYNIMEEMKIQMVTIILLLVKHTVFKLPMMTLRQLMLMLPLIN